MKAVTQCDSNGLFVICPKCGNIVDYDPCDGGFWCDVCKQSIEGD